MGLNQWALTMSGSSNPIRPILVPDAVSRQNRKLVSLIGVKSKIKSTVNVDLRPRFEQLRVSASEVMSLSALPDDILDACIMVLAALGRISLFVEFPGLGCFEISSSAFRESAWTFLPVHTIADSVLNLVMARVSNHSFDAPFNGRPILCSEAQVVEELKLGKPSKAEILRAIEKVIVRFESGELPKIQTLLVAEVRKLPGLSSASKNRILDLSKLHRKADGWKKPGPRSNSK